MNNILKQDFEKLRSLMKDKKSQDFLADMEKRYQEENKYHTQKIDKLISYAGVGIAADIGYHDLNAKAGSCFIQVEHIMKDYPNDDNLIQLKEDINSIQKRLINIEDGIHIPYYNNKDSINVSESFDIVVEHYKYYLKSQGIELSINNKSKLSVNMNKSVMIQTIIILLDNSINSLENIDKNKEIKFILDGKNKNMIVADNGPGIDEFTAPYIFEPFFTKREKGDRRGLGLGIIRDLHEKLNSTIELSDKKVLSGANFIIKFEG